MTAHDVPFLWCVLQAALLAILGVAATWLFSRRAPAAAAIAAASAAATIALVTLLMPVHLPKLELWTPPHAGDAVAAPAPAIATGDDSSALAVTTDALSIDVEYFAQRLFGSLSAVHLTDQNVGPLTESCVVALVAVGAAVGLLRLLGAMRFVTRLHRSRLPIVVGEPARHFADLKRRLGVRRSVELCESALVASPAVIGWRRPIVLLPVERAGWTEEQLCATLAHELAHVVRGDFFWRFVASVTQSIHFFHPLVHLLMRRLTLAQELATDRLAAGAVGGTAVYLRALSELAIRLDDNVRLRAEPIVLPALSSNLPRRITMLRSKEGSTGEEGRPRGGFMAAGLIALVGTGTMAMRGSAESGAVIPTAAADDGGVFAAELVDLSFMGPADAGLLVVRPSRMAQRTPVAPAIQFVDEYIRNAVAEQAGAAATQPSGVSAIDFYAM